MSYFEQLIRCNYCSRLTTGIYVHGHKQCSWCKTNIEPCCQGQENVNAVCNVNNPQQSVKISKVN